MTLTHAARSVALACAAADPTHDAVPLGTLTRDDAEAWLALGRSLLSRDLSPVQRDRLAVACVDLSDRLNRGTR